MTVLATPSTTLGSDLRGLGPNHTLVLVNGRRIADFPLPFLTFQPEPFVQWTDAVAEPAGESRDLEDSMMDLALEVIVKTMFGLPGFNTLFYLLLGSVGIDYMIHHLLSHSDGADWLKVNQFFMEQLAYLARKLDSIREGERTLLDNTMLMHCSSMMVGAKHNNDELPIIVLGGAELALDEEGVGQGAQGAQRELVVDLVLHEDAGVGLGALVAGAGRRQLVVTGL